MHIRRHKLLFSLRIMFYQESQINKKLVCFICHDSLYEPKVLPCGNVLCNYCYKLILINQSPDLPHNVIKCTACRDLHDLPKNGLQTCALISKLVQEKPTEIYRGSIHTYLKNNLKCMASKIDELDYSFRNASDRIRDHCYNLRFDIQLAKEVMINELEKKSQQLIAQVDSYEADCIQKFECGKDEDVADFKKNFQACIDEMTAFKTEWSDYILKAQLNEESLLKANYLANERVIKLRKQEVLLKSVMFSENLLSFKKSISLDANLIGSLQQSTIKLINLSKLTRVNIKPFFFSIKSSAHGKTVAISLDSGRLVFAFINKKDQLEMFVYDKEVRLQQAWVMSKNKF